MHAEVTVDFGYLTKNSVNLDFDMAHEGCRVVHAPRFYSASRLKGTFYHEAADGEMVTPIRVGPQNPDFVPLDEISRHLINSILTTEDSRFYRHRGFIHREFRTALARNLIARKFKYGASSISMQLVKNVLLNREKTLSRKLQELIFTAYVERHLTKDRILEIYLNVIEFGPGIYGIGPASLHYFGKPASLIEPQEAAFLSTLLPNPKKRYINYCRGKLSPWWRRWVDRILHVMHRRDRLTKTELDVALAAPVVFSRLEFVSEADCKRRIGRYLSAGD
jgi:membrane peptidoglycan carboxypeptidase